jgi:hypothetical protein
VTLRAQRELCDANVLAAFQLVRRNVGDPRGASREFGGATAIVSGLEPPFYNPIFVLRRAAAADVAAAIDWVTGLGVTPSVQAREELDRPVAAIAAEHGLIADQWRDPGMALAIPARIPEPPPELEIREVHDESGLEDWHESAISGPSIRRFINPEAMRDPDLRLVVGYVDGRPVSGGAAIMSPGAVGLYAIGTIEAARRRGYGQAITWAAIAAGRAVSSAATAVLQASELGASVYRSMGFVEVCRYVAYMPEASA